MRRWLSLACCPAWAVVAIMAGADLAAYQTRSPQPERPNIVLMLPDNVGYGEVGIYGGDRFVPTPRLDGLAREGMRLTNFNVEYYCTPSRAAILTGRHGVRSGTNGDSRDWLGLTQWEITLAELLAPRGYTSALFGKWHLGDKEGRYPTDQGFDQWYGIPRTSNEAQRNAFDQWYGSTSNEAQRYATGQTSYIWEGKVGEPARQVKVFDLASRRTLDREATERAVAFMERSTRERKSFFLFLPLTQIHFPTLPHPEYAGKTGAGDIGDAMAEMDRNVGVVLDAVTRLAIEKNTIVIWASDGGAEARRPWRGTSGPWRGFYHSALEGGIRTPFMIRWPGRIPAGQVSNEIVHQVDVFTTLAHAAGVDVPHDRAIDGVNQLPFFEGKQAESNREGFPIFVGTQLRAVKWRDWKLHYAWQDEPEPGRPVARTMKLFNLRSDPKEETDVKDANPWAETVMGRIVSDFEASLEKHPLIPLGTPDPYTPPIK